MANDVERSADRGPQNTALVCLPTYNERESLAALVDEILRTAPVDILVIDDNSPDGTGGTADLLAQRDPRVRVMHRAGKLGLGSAYVEAFRWALPRGYQLIFEMDADFSHDPNEIPNFLSKMGEADLVLGSRYIDGIRVANWPLSRLALSKGASWYVRVITGLPVADPTGGFKCFRRKVLEAIELDSIHSNGYAYQIEMTYKAWMKNFQVREIPITFTDRYAGQSKMSGGIVREALWVVWALAVAHGFRRRPPRRVGHQ